MTNRLNLPSESEIRQVLRLDHEQLPSFPQAAAKLIEKSRDETASLKDLSEIMETDPGLSAQILKIVNSALYGLGRKITTLSEAVIFLGLDEVKKQALGVTMFKHMFKNGRTEQFDRLLFWRHSLAVAVLSLEIAKETGHNNPEEAYIAGLLHDVGKIFLDLQGKENYSEFIRTLSTSTDLVIESERQHIGLGHDEIGAYFCSLWELPEKLVAAVKYHHQPFAHLDLSDEDKTLISIVSLADFVCWTQGIGSFDFIRPPILAPEVTKTIAPDQIDIIKCITAMNREVENISAFYQFVFPSASQLKENLLWANLKLSRINTRYYYQEEPLMQIQDAKEDESYLESEFGKPLARAKSVKEVLDIVMYQIGRIFEPRNWSILLKDPKTGNLVFSVVVGENKKKLQGAKLPKGEGIAGYIMETGESIIVEDVSKDERFSRRVDNYTGFQTQSIIGTPLKTCDKTFGVIQLINRNIKGAFSKKDMNQLASIAEYAAIAIERSYYTQALTNLATKDSLTGLKNRWSFERAVSNKTEFKIQYGSIFSMLIITVGDLDRILREKGQGAHDASLKDMVRIMNNTKRRDDTIFRYGENIFLILLPLTYSDGSEKTKDRIEDAISLAVSKQKLPPVSITIVHHTLSSEEIGTFTTLVSNSLAESKQPVNDEQIADIKENLQPLVEKEKKQEADERGDKKGLGKAVSLIGHFIHAKTRKSVSIRVKQISRNAIGFTLPKSVTLRVDDFLDIQFVLDNLKRAVIKRQIIIRKIEGDYIQADFYNPPPYAKNLGFYLIK